jgi:hypothetical protein
MSSKESSGYTYLPNQSAGNGVELDEIIYRAKQECIRLGIETEICKGERKAISLGFELITSESPVFRNRATSFAACQFLLGVSANTVVRNWS